MNIERPASSPDLFRSLQILDELSNNDSLTQRDLSNRLGIALGLVNSYIRNLAAKGFITVKNIPPKRYVYYLTPTGFSEKTRLTYHLLQDYTRVYREAKHNLKQLFQELGASGFRRIVFAGADEVAEIAYLTLQETELELIGVIDNDKAGSKFFNREVRPLDGVSGLRYDCIVVTTYLKRDAIKRELVKLGVQAKVLRVIF